MLLPPMVVVLVMAGQGKYQVLLDQELATLVVEAGERIWDALYDYLAGVGEEMLVLLRVAMVLQVLLILVVEVAQVQQLPRLMIITMGVTAALA
jgi:hypothetical protein